MTFIRDMDKNSGEYAAAVDQAFVHCNESKWSIREAGELLYAKLYSPSAPFPVHPSIVAAEGFDEFIDSLERETGIKVEFVVARHALSIHKQYVRWVKEASLLYSIVADAKMALQSHKNTSALLWADLDQEPFTARDMVDDLVRAYHKKTEAMALLLAQEVVLMGQTADYCLPDIDGSVVGSCSESDENEEDHEEHDGEESDGESDGSGGSDDAGSDNDNAISGLAEARAELGIVDNEEYKTNDNHDELVDELRGLVVDAEDMVEGLEELKKMEESIVANGGSMAVGRSINDETSWDLPETFLSFFNEISSSDRHRKRLRVYDSPDDE
jgi:hypothetical protein